MSFLKFWGKKSRAKDDLDLRKEETDAEAEKRKLRHTLSISRSGRFKQKKRERGGILDRPELYGGEGAEGDFKDYQEQGETSSTTSTSSSSSTSRPPPQSSSSSSSSSSANPSYSHHHHHHHPGNSDRRAGHSMAT